MYMRLLALLVAVLTVAAACADEGETESDGTEFDVAVSFTTEYTQADVDTVADHLRSFDPEGEFFVQESFSAYPPWADDRCDAAAFCDTVIGELSQRPYVSGVTCTEHQDEPAGSPDEPVSTQNP
jgi:hypothetical protein